MPKSTFKKQLVSRGLLTLVIVGMLLLIFTPVLINCWDLVTGRGFIIPEQSSIFTFRVTEENHGSGEWWLYGEDHQYFYALTEDEDVPYVAFLKSKVAECPGFNPHDYKTWCHHLRIRPHKKSIIPKTEIANRL